MLTQLNQALIQLNQATPVLKTKAEINVTPAGMTNSLPPPGVKTPPGHSMPKLDLPDLNVTSPSATPVDTAQDIQFYDEGLGSQHLTL